MVTQLCYSVFPRTAGSDQKPHSCSDRSEVSPRSPSMRNADCPARRLFVWQCPFDFTQGLALVERLPAKQKMCPPRSPRLCGEILFCS